LEVLVQHNALNRTGEINYNKYGKKDRVGFVPVTDMFVDNFLLKVPLADYHIDENGNYTEVGAVNMTIGGLLKRNDFKKFEVKAVALKKCKNLAEDVLQKMPYRIPEKENDETLFYYQEYKIACADVPYQTVLTFLRGKEYNNYSLYLKDIDITLDYAGSFNRDEVVQCMEEQLGFRCEGEHKHGERTILNNVRYVGNNCLTYMEEVDDVTTRCKIYNKFVQALESKAVRGYVGQHWRDWVAAENTRLAEARDRAKERGLTRAEVTFYINKDGVVPSDKFMSSVLLNVTRYVYPGLVYSTPFRDTWKVYCENMVHSLVVIDRRRDMGIVVYSYNEFTKKISGHLVKNWNRDEKMVLATLLLNLPVDIIEIQDTRERVLDGDKMLPLLTITGGRYYRVNDKEENDFTTRIIDRSVGGCKHGSKDENAQFLLDAGFVPHRNCKPFLAKDSNFTKGDREVKLLLLDELHIYLNYSYGQLQRECLKIKEIVDPFLEETYCKKIKIDRMEEYRKIFIDNKVKDLKKLPACVYDVLAVKSVGGRAANTYTFIVQSVDGLSLYRANAAIRDFFSRLDMPCYADKFYASGFTPLCSMEVIGLARDKNRNLTVCVSMKRKTCDNDSEPDCKAKKMCL